MDPAITHLFKSIIRGLLHVLIHTIPEVHAGYPQTTDPRVHLALSKLSCLTTFRDKLIHKTLSTD